MNSITARLNPLTLSRCEEQDAPIAETANTAEFELPDEAVISGLLNGDKDAWNLLFRRYARTVHSVAYKVLRDVFEADDLVQEIFLLIRRKCADFDRSKGSVRFWILQMAYHRAISRRRYLSCRHFYTRVELDDAQQKVSNPQIEIRQFEESIDASLGRSDVQKMFESLSENQRITLKRHFFDGYTLDEVAAELGQSRDNVRHHYFRGLDKLRKQLFAQKPGR